MPLQELSVRGRGAGRSSQKHSVDLDMGFEGKEIEPPHESKRKGLSWKRLCFFCSIYHSMKIFICIMNTS